MLENKKKPLLYTGIFCFSFILFAYLTFPYGILKEAVVVQISRATGISIRLKELGPSFPLGISAEGVTVIDGATKVELKELDVNLSLLPLLIGKLQGNLSLVSKNNGELDLSVAWGVGQLASQDFIPGSVEVEADNFDVGSLLSFGVASFAKSANDLIKGTLAKIKIAGNLKGKMSLDLDTTEPSQSSGVIKLDILKGTLDMNDPNLGVPKQSFKKALIQASLAKGVLNINPNSGFHTKDLFVDLKGKSFLKSPLTRSSMDINIELKLGGKLKENFDFLLNMAGGSNGGARFRLGGTFARPSFQVM